jgi:glycolate oxidase FAD binding subunit
VRVIQALKPSSERDLAHILSEAARGNHPIEIVAGGSKRKIGRPMNVEAEISLKNIRGLIFYEPAEMVISVRAATPVAGVETELAKHNQMLAFEPIDLGPMLGEAPQTGTVGGMVGTNLSGARRIAGAAVRDHVLGLRAVNGRGEAFKSGGRVMKNVTGYDLCRGLAGSWGTLAALTEVTLRAVPKPEETRSLLLFAQPDEIAIEVLSGALGTPYEVTGAVHIHAPLVARLAHPLLKGAGNAVTALRVEGFSSSVAYRIGKLKEMFAAYGDMLELDHTASLSLWEELRRLSMFERSENPVWRISTPPAIGPRVVGAIATYMPVLAAYDWSGGLIWLEVPASVDAGSADIRRVIATRGGHATLIRAEPDVRRTVEVFQPLDAPLQKLSLGLKQSFDPAGIMNPRRMYQDF